MQEVTLQVPAGYVGTLREATKATVGFWADAVRDEATRHEGVRQVAEADLAFARERMAGAIAMLDQITRADAGLELEAPVGAAADVAVEAMKLCADHLIQHLTGVRDITGGELAGMEDVRPVQAELDWWAEQYERLEAMRGKAREAVAA